MVVRSLQKKWLDQNYMYRKVKSVTTSQKSPKVGLKSQGKKVMGNFRQMVNETIEFWKNCCCWETHLFLFLSIWRSISWLSKNRIEKNNSKIVIFCFLLKKTFNRILNSMLSCTLFHLITFCSELYAFVNNCFIITV